jgi:hypothetical protein
MKKFLILLAIMPALAVANPENGVQRFDKANEGAYFGGRERINPTSRELRSISRDQGVPISKKRGGFPLAAQGTVDLEPADAAETPVNSALSAPPAPSYRTLGDAAKAGVDPLSLVKPRTPTAPTEPEDGKYDTLYWAGGILGFILVGGLFFLFSLRTPQLREN